jgi:hypothetical protein
MCRSVIGPRGFLYSPRVETAPHGGGPQDLNRLAGRSVLHPPATYRKEPLSRSTERLASAPITSAVATGLSMFGLLDYRGWPRRRLQSPRTERMKVKPPSAPSAQSVQTKKKPPLDLAISP